MSDYARVLVYVKSSFEYERLEELEHESVQSIWLKGGFKNGKKLIFCHTYREHTNCLGNSIKDQQYCLEKLLNQWDMASDIKLSGQPSEIHICGYMNLDAMNGKWMNPSYHLYKLSRMVHSV